MDSAKLSPFLSPERKARIETVLEGRSTDIAVVLDGTHDLGNIHAVVRTSEGLGFDQIHVIESQERFRKANRTAQGADTWVDFHRYSDPGACVKELRARGYRLLVTTLEGDQTLDDIDFTIPTAIVLGNEKSGVSPLLLESAELRVCLPMSGFAQSFNVSVAGAMVLWTAHQDRRRRLGRSGNLTEPQKHALRDRYYRQSVDRADEILRELESRQLSSSSLSGNA